MPLTGEAKQAYMREYRRRNPDARDRAGYQRRRRAARGGEARMRKLGLVFRGCDGEGGNLPDTDALFGTKHHYLLLRAGEHVLKHPLGAPLNSAQCLAFLADLPKTGVCYVGYYFDYDTTMILRDLPVRVLRRIASNPLAGTKWNGYQIRYLPHKELAVRRVDRETGEPLGAYTVVNDVGPFFQQSFVKTLEQWGVATPAQLDMIRAGKEQRAQFGALTRDVEEYNALECTLLEQVMDEFREACDAAGVLPRRWQGPGNLAAALLAAHGMPRTKEVPALANERLRSLANDAYYGGRFETFMTGPVPGPVYEYDINSAYPAAMVRLPCLRCGTWAQRKAAVRPGPDELWFGPVEFEHAAGSRVCHLPVRVDTGTLIFPLKGEGVYWSPEVQAAERSGMRWRTAGPWYAYVPGPVCRCVPFEWLPELYEQRKRMGKSGRGKVLKLAINSLYGKLAQSVGRPPYANPIWAGLITAYTRAMLIDAYRGFEEQIVMVATDAVYSRVPLPVPTGEGLGLWEEAVHPDGLFTVMPGMYYAGADARSKTRGVHQAAFDDARADVEAAFRCKWADDGFDSAAVVRQDVFWSLKLALARGKPWLAGQWSKDQRKRISLSWETKRDRAADRDAAGFFHTRPLTGGWVSVPYGRVIGGSFEDVRLEQGGQPDWTRNFIPV